MGGGILKGKEVDRLQTIDFKKTAFELFKELVGRKGKGAEESLLLRCVRMMSEFM